ncbi:PucR family transcriptional regulator, partial [Streptomyces polyrhachis]
VLLPGGAGGAPRWQVVVARVETGGEAPADGAEVARDLLEEILLDPSLDRVAVAHSAEEAVALLPLPPTGAAGGAEGPGGPGGAEDADAPLKADALLAAVERPLAQGLGDGARLTIGVSAPVPSSEGLRGALEEARHARRVAAARDGRVCAAGHEELASHVLLLPFVPDDVRRAFTARLLDPLREYDRRHRADLVETLEAFLDCDGSWTRCAARLHLHVNTLRYRVGRIEQLTGRDLSRLEDKLDFFLALRMG